MSKLILTFAFLFCVLTIGLARKFPPPKCDTPTPKPAPYDDPNFFYLCIDKSMNVVVPCGEGRGFIDNADLLGCVPWKEWKCLQPAAKPACDAAAIGKNFKHEDPNKYWSCTAAGAAEEKTCDAGKGFDPTATTPECVAWEHWEVCT